MRPKDDAERAEWRKNVEKGWAEGYEQADEVFEQDLNRLFADFSGMVRYRQLLAQGMVSAPFAQQVDRGITGDRKDASMRVGDRAVVITGVPQLITESQRWQPQTDKPDQGDQSLVQTWPDEPHPLPKIMLIPF